MYTAIARLTMILWCSCASQCAIAQQASVRTNVVLILADDMRPDCLGALGHQFVETPHLDRLAAEGVLFTQAVAAYPICFASRAEILTGTTAFRNGLPYGRRTIDPSLATWAGTFRDAGWHTAYSGKWHNDGTPTTRGYVETCGLYSSGGAPAGQTVLPDHAGRPATGYVGWTFKTPDGAVELDKGVGLTPLTDTHVCQAAVEFIERPHRRPFFLHVNFTAPHDPRIWPDGSSPKPAGSLELPTNFAPQHPFDHGNLQGRDERLLSKPLEREQVIAELAVYYACIEHIDRLVGRMVFALQQADLLDSTIIIFSSDQGLALGSHGLLGKQNLYEHSFGVPLICRGPGVARGLRQAADVYVRDLFPTCCEMVGLPIPPTVEARSLGSLLRGDTAAVHDFVVGYFTDTQRCIRYQGWKLIDYPLVQRQQLFDLNKDPHELRDLLKPTESSTRFDPLDNSEPAVRREQLNQLLAQWLTAQAVATPEDSTPANRKR